jgi:hypothetical protein
MYSTRETVTGLICDELQDLRWRKPSALTDIVNLGFFFAERSFQDFRAFSATRSKKEGILDTRLAFLDVA